MAKFTDYILNVNTQYLRTSESKFPDRENDKQEGVCNNFNNRKNDGKPLWIMEHHTVGNLESSLNTFLNGGISAHYMIAKDGTVYNLVGDEYRSYHAGPGYLNPKSKLNPNLSSELMKGANKEGVLGSGSGDMNSWSIGIENVNSAFEPFTAEQTKANIYLHEKLVNDHHIDAKNIISHAEWAIGRKCDPSPYYDWKALATASEKYEDITHNFGIYPNVDFKLNSEVILAYNVPSNSKEDSEHVQRQLVELGYDVLTADDQNLGVYDQKTRDGVFAFTIRYMNRTITDDVNNLELWNQVDSNSNLCRTALGKWTQNHDEVMIDVLGQYSEA